MELSDYLAALRRHWRTGAASLGLCLAAVTIALLVIPPTYSATASVFASASPSISNSAQYAVQRAQTYSSIAESSTVLGPVIDRLGLDETPAQIRAQVTATAQPDTSELDITATGHDPQQAAALANAVADELVRVLPDLEKHAAGDPPVELTVTDPATVPSVPESPQPVLLLGLGLIVGLALGAAGAVVHSRLDTRLYDEDDVRRAWGPGGEALQVLAAERRGRRFAGRPATLLARQLEPQAEQSPVRVVALAPSADQRGARCFLEDLAAELLAWGVPVGMADSAGDETTHGDRPGVQLAVSAPHAPMREWRRRAQRDAGVVIVVEPGRTDRADLRELRSILMAAGLRPVAVVVHRPHRRRPSAEVSGSGASGSPAPSASAQRQDDPVPAGRR